MTTLILGGTGFIGRRAVPRLASRGERVAVMDINPNAANFEEFGDLVTVMRGDIMDFEDVVKAILESKPDRIMNLAYLLGSGDDTPHFTMKLNVLGMDNCFEAARVCGVNRVTYASSVAVSGQQSAFGDRMVNEDDAMHGTSQYAMHKRFNEFQAQQFNSVYGMNITGIRPANVTGPDKVRGSTDHVQCVTLPASGEPVRFPKSGFMRLPVHVDDVAEAFVRVTMSTPALIPSTTPAAFPSAWATWPASCAASCPTPTFPSTPTAARRTPATILWTTAACWESSSSSTRRWRLGCAASSTTCAATTASRRCSWTQRRKDEKFYVFLWHNPLPSQRQTGRRIIPSPSEGGLGWGWHLTILTLSVALVFVAVLSAGTTSANGAVRLVVIDEVAGPYLLRVGVLPSEPTLGPLHVSILVQDATGETAVDDATVSVAATGPGAPSQTEAVNSPQSPQLYEGNLWLDALGDWSLTLDIESSWAGAATPSPFQAREEGGFNLMFVIAAAAAVLVVGSLVLSQLQRRRRLRRAR